MSPVSGEDVAVELRPIPIEEVRLWLNLISYNLGELKGIRHRGLWAIVRRIAALLTGRLITGTENRIQCTHESHLKVENANPRPKRKSLLTTPPPSRAPNRLARI